jgi:iron complex outermembrane receptor protein
MKKGILLCAASLASVTPFLTSTAMAQEPASGASSGSGNILNEIVVSGVRRREESVQSVPVAVTALNSELLERNNVTSTAGLNRLAPNLVIVRQLATPAQASLYLRGFGSESNSPAIDPPVAITVDGIYQPQSSGNLLDLFDVETVEVQRGPQGTLQGKNAPTGSLTIVSKRPTFNFEGAAEASYERFNHVSLKARINVPVVPDVLAVKLTGIYKKGGNFIRSLQEGGKRRFGGEKGFAGKVGILFTPSSNVEWLVNAFYERDRNPQTGMRDLSYLGAEFNKYVPEGSPAYQGTGLSCVVFGHCAPTKRFTTNSGWNKGHKSNTKQVSSQLTFRTDPVTITAMTGYKKYSELNNTDVDGQPEPLLDALGDPLHYDQFSQEIRLNSAKGGGLDMDGKLDWVIGGYYSKFKYSNQQTLSIFGPIYNSDEHGKTTSKALFAQAIYSITDQFNITLGGRQSWDKKTHNYIPVLPTALYDVTPTIVDAPISFKNFSMELGAQYKIAPDKQVYVRYAEGYRSGGYQGLPGFGIPQSPYKPETVQTYEIGFKGDFMDRHLRVNVSAFLSKYKNLQRTVIGSLDVAPFYTQEIKNAADADVKGIELEVTAVPTDALTIAMSLNYLDNKYKNYVATFIAGFPATNHDDFPFPYSSKWSGRISPTYTIDMGDNQLILSATAAYASRYYVAGIPYPAARVRSLVDVSARAKLDVDNGKYSISIYGENLTNNHFIENFTTPPGGNALYFAGADHKPITYGIAVGAKF